MNPLARAKSLIDEVWTHPDRWTANLAEADRLLRAVVEAEPTNVEALTCLGAVLSDRGKHQEAALTLKKAIGLGSMDRNTYFNMAVALINSSTHEHAMDYFRKANALSASPRTWEAYFDAQGQ
jgi:Flp pilus assembly protein TadD